MVEIVETLTLVFLSASLMMLVFHRYNHPTIPAYILAGVLISPLVDETAVLDLAFLGIAFLVFVFGMRLDKDRVYRLVGGHFTTAFLQVALVGSVTFLIAWLWGLKPVDSVVLAMAASLSSSMVATEILSEEGSGNYIHLRISEAVNLVQDLIAIVAFIAIGLWMLPQGQLGSFSLWLGVILVAAVLTREALPVITRVAGGSREIMMLVAVTLLTAFVFAADQAGLTVVVGSFAAGVAVSKFPYNLEMLETTRSLRDFFSAILFVSLGAAVSVPGLRGILVAGGLLFVILLFKPAVTVMSVEYHGYDSRTAYLTAFHLNQISEFSLILAIQLFLAGALDPEIFHAIVLVAAVSMLISSYTSRYGDRIYDFLEEKELIDPVGRFVEEDIDEDLEDHCILVGFGVQGKMIAAFLEENDIPFVIVENDPAKIISARENGYMYVFGDAMEDAVWKTARVEAADLVITTPPLDKISEKAISLDTDASVIVREEDRDKARSLAEQCLFVINSDILTSRRILDHLEKSLESDEYRETLREESMEEMRE